MSRWRQSLNVIFEQGEFWWSPKNKQGPPTDLNRGDWLIVQMLPNRVPADTEFAQVTFKDFETKNLQAVWRKKEGQWKCEPVNQPDGSTDGCTYFTVEDASAGDAPGKGPFPGSIKITNTDPLNSGDDRHLFEVVFNDGLGLDPEIINRGGAR